MTPNTRVAIYTRVSTDDNRQTVENQLRDLKRYAKFKKWRIVAEYSDKASGTKADRPGYRRLMEDAKKGNFEVVLVWRLDRFTRAGARAALAAIEELNNADVLFHSFNEPMFQTTGPLRDVFVSLIAAIAQYERDLISERSRAGVRRAQAEGKHCGRPAKFGIRHKVLKLRKRKLSLSVIATQLGVHVSTVCRILKAEKEQAS